MKKKLSILSKFLIIVICFLVVGVGCVKKPKKPTTPLKPTTPKTIPKMTPNTKGSGSLINPSKSTTNAIPKSLERIERDSKDIVEDISKKDWGNAKEKLTSIEREWSSYHGTTRKENISTTHIDTFTKDLADLKKFVKEEKQYEASLAANKLSLDTLGFMELYKPKIPTYIGKLNYYVRQIMITAEHDDWGKAKAELKSAESTWTAAKGEVDKINSSHAKSISDTLARLSTAIKEKNIKTTKELSRKLLDEINTIESDFKKR